MAEIVVEIVGRVVIEIVGLAITGAIREHQEQRRSQKSISTTRKQNRSLAAPSSSVKSCRSTDSSSFVREQTSSLPELSSSSAPQERAVLIASSDISFGNACERLINIAFETSRAFPTIMGTYADVSQYLHKELARQYPHESFHIIIGQNETFGFSIDDGQYFAEIEQKQYRVLIFTTKQNSHTKLDSHDANSQMLFVWK